MSDTGFPADADVAGIGVYILRLRVEQGMTQTELAGTEFTRAYVSSIEGGKRTPAPRAAGYFASRLGLDFEDLCFGYAAGRRRALLKEAAQARIALSRGELERATAAYSALSDEAEEHHDRTLLAAGRCGLGLVARHRGDPGAADVLFQEADGFLADQPLTDRLPALMGRMWALFAGGFIGDALAHAAEHLRQAGPTPAPAVEFALLAASGLFYVEQGDLTRAGAAADAALRLAPEVSEPEVLAQGYYHLNRVLVAQARHEEAEQAIVRATALYEHLQLRTEVGMCRFAHGFLSARRGLLSEAETQLRQARTILGDTGAISRLVNASAELAEVLRRLGRAEEAAALVEECRALALDYQDPEQVAELDRIGAHVAADLGDADTGAALFRSAIDRYQAVGATLEVATTCRLFGDQLISWGRTDEAASVYRRGLMSLERTK